MAILLSLIPDLNTALWMLQNAQVDGDGRYYYVMRDGSKVIFTVEPKLQAMINSLLSTYPKEYVGLALIDATSGRILAIGGRFKGAPSLRSFKMNDYPAASLFKVITSVAAMESLGIGPGDSVDFCGPIYRRRPKRWLNCRGEPYRTTLAMAFGTSNNPAFGRLAVRIGSGPIRDVAERFFYDDTLLGLPMGYVEWDSVRTVEDLALLGSGFAYSYMNPVQAILIGEAMATGIVWRPYVVDRIERGDSLLIRTSPTAVGFPIGEPTLVKLRELARATVDSGTVRKVFHDREGRRLLPVSVGGKTGTLRSRKYGGLTEWFVGFAPVENPRVVVVAFSMDGTYNNVKTAYLAMRALQGYFMGKFVGNPVSFKRFIRRKRRRSRGG
ncbi:MAG: hypothetical protein GXO29_01940 [Thermotogae bacterium]|nr:hypothetical protein [Thermotogota bacterium]